MAYEEEIRNESNCTVLGGGAASFAGLKKKKKKPVDANSLCDVAVAVAGEVKNDKIGQDKVEDASERDYSYEELLSRVFNVVREFNPGLAGNTRKTVIRPPQVMREGTKKTVLANFADLCKMMHRQPEHVMSFLLAELGTSGSLDGQQRLVIKGRFAPKNFEGMLRRYMNEYVICNGCKSGDTIFVRENRLTFLRCEQCGSSRTVPPVTGGYVARVERRGAA